MQKAIPLVLVLTLAVTAFLLSVREQDTRQQDAADSAPAMVGDDPSAPQVPAHPWPHEASDITPDPATLYGALRNGMRYAIHPNAEPPGRVSLRLHIRAGSLMEADDQRGLAHFLEHMLFNGTRNYSPAEMIPRMQRLGIAFGAHANARTSFDETYYMLDLPDLSEDTLQLAFTAMRDFADGALLHPEEIEKERGVVLAEKISRDSVGYRVMQRQFDALLPDALLTRRFPIGTEEVIRSAPRERFADFYQRYYTPQRMTFIAVGDIDPQVMRARIESAFASMKNPAVPGTDPDPGVIREAEGIEPLVIDDKELASTDVALMRVKRYLPEPDTRAARVDRLPLALAHAMLERRLGRIARGEASPISAGSAARNVWFETVEMGAVGVTAADDRWQEAVAVLEREFRRAMEHGFLPGELAEAKSVLLNTLEQQVRQKPTRRSEGIAAVMIRCIGADDVFPEPETELAITREALDAVDAARCHDAMRTFWDAPGHHLVLTTKSRVEDTARELTACFEESRGIPVDPPRPEELPAFAYETFGPAGTVASETRVEDLGITQLVLSNQVRINLKRTDFESGRIHLLARIGSGQLTQPAGKPMLDTFAQAVFDGGGLGKHGQEELERMLAGKNVGCSLAIDEDAFVLSGSTTPADFPLQCRLLCAAIADPGWREEALWQFQKSIPVLMQQLRHTTRGPLREMQSWLHGADARYSAATLDQLASYTIADARDWLGPELADGYLELSIVGDIDPQAALPELLATFGALPTRDATPAAHPDKRKVESPAPPGAVVFRYESTIPQAMALMMWKTAGQRGNPREFRRLHVLASVLKERLREEIRENLGASYSPVAIADGSEALENVGHLLGQSVCNPEDIGKILSSMRSEASTLAADGTTADELDRARRPILGMMEKSLRDNQHWLRTVLGRSQAEPERLELARDRDADYRSITLDELNTLAAKYLGGGNAISITIRPQAP